MSKHYDEFKDLAEALDFAAHLIIQGYRPEWHRIYKRNTYIVLWEVPTRRNLEGGEPK